MEDKEIIKALEYCTKQGITSECEKCKVKNNGCRHELMLNALDLINRQKAEIEDLKKVVVNDYASEYDDKIKAEAVKEFAERLKVKIPYITSHLGNVSVMSLHRHIDNLLKETVGDADD